MFAGGRKLLMEVTAEINHVTGNNRRSHDPATAEKHSYRHGVCVRENPHRGKKKKNHVNRVM